MTIDFIDDICSLDLFFGFFVEGCLLAFAYKIISNCVVEVASSLLELEDISM